MARGIDYGMGTTNRDPKTGIRYGVLPQNDVLQAWCDSSEPVYPEPEPLTCETCDGEGTVTDDDRQPHECEDCNGTGEIDDDDSFSEPTHHEYMGEGIAATCGEGGDIFITKSPFYTRAAFCSPCAPGACYLRSPCEDGEKAYCLGHDWFEEGTAPYPVYSVETDELVPAPAK